MSNTEIPASPAPPDYSQARRRLVLITCCSSVAVTGINLSMVNVALPSIRSQLHASVGGLQWTVSAYSLAMACLLLLSGSMADRFGRRRLFSVGLLAFALGSGAAALAPSIGWLVAATAVQGAGGSMLNPVALSIVVDVYTDPVQRSRAIGVWGSTIGLTIAIGPVLGGLLVDVLSWRSVFWTSVSIAGAAFVLTRLVVPESKAGRARAFDLPGQGLMALFLATVVAATIEGPRWGWSDLRILALFALATGTLVALLVIEPRQPEPLIDLRLFRSPPFTGAIAISVVMAACLAGFLFLNTMYLQETRHFTPLHAGLLILPLAAAQLGSSILAGRILAAHGARRPLALGALLLAVGSSLLIPANSHTSISHLLIAYGLFGLGVGLISPSVTNSAVSGMPRDQVGVAGALAASARQFGSSLGVAGVGAILSSGQDSFPGVSPTAWTVVTAAGLMILVLSLASTGQRARVAAARTSQYP